ncbi:MAG: hypothetical protein C0399_11775 [Syntrophus sp. (in: bacteria)]|nr:hypothetical protein [Syntrophus sp. (in: bacteria)]
MEQTDEKTLSLKLTAGVEFLPVVISFVEKTAEILGLAKNEYLQLTLAAEEIFSYLARSVCPGSVVSIQCFNGIYFTKVSFQFPVAAFHLGGLNITSTVSPENESNLDEMGLVIAARFVDKLAITKKKHNEVELTIIKEKAYPPGIAATVKRPFAAESFIIERPDGETVKLFAMMIDTYSGDSLLPAFFKYPGKVADMVFSGDYQALTAMNQRREICGGILFHHRNEKIIESYGPFVFTEEGGQEIGVALWEACLNSLARTKTIGVVSIYGLPEWLQKDSEDLGYFEYSDETIASMKMPVFYRLLHEDPGGVVWTDESLLDYLRKEYDRLFLARDIRIVANLGEHHGDASIFSTEFLKDYAQAMLRPLWPGRDAEKNVHRHIQTLLEENISNIFFEIDSGIPWHAELIPALVGNGFTPSMIIPFAGESDLIIFRYHAPRS